MLLHRLFQYLAAEVKRVWNTLWWSLEGLAVAWREEKSFRQWSYVNLINWALLYYCAPPLPAVLLLLTLGILVLIVELLNSAIEATVDYISEERHPMAKKAKDIASAAVFLSALVWGAAWLITAYYLYV